MKSFTLLLHCLIAAALSIAFPCLATPHEDYSGKDLQRKDFVNGNLNNARFDGANLESANFTNATLKNASFRDAKLQGVNFGKAVLDGADFSGADLKKARFTDAKVWNAKLSGTEIHLAGATQVDYSKLNLNFAAERTLNENRELNCGSLSFHYSDMRNCRIFGNAEGVDFRGADLRGADLSGAANLESARLGGAKYDEQTRWKIDPAKMRAEFVASAAIVKDDTAKDGKIKPSTHALIGGWLIMKGEKGAVEAGTLKINPDLSYEWDFSANSPPIKGNWEEAGDQVLLKKGEKGQNWKAKPSAKDEILLTSEKGDERVAVSNK